MKQPATDKPVTTVRDSKSGKFVTVKGVGALHGKMTISKKVDLTKPLTVSARGEKWNGKGAVFSTKAAKNSGSPSGRQAKR